jgi:hypothetical protein
MNDERYDVPDVESVVAESLARLRKGPGVVVADLESRVSPEFRELCAAATDRGDELRAKVSQYLLTLCRALTEELSLAARVVLNLHPDAQHQRLAQRYVWLAERLRYDERTVRRRVDTAFAQMARNAATGDIGVSGIGHGGNGWYVERLHALVRLDLPRLEVIEQRTIVVTAPALDRITHAVSVPRHPAVPVPCPAPGMEMMFGGIMAVVERPNDTLLDNVITLPRPLRKGDRHDYGVVVRMPPDRRMVPHYLCQPLRPCRRFSVRVRFALDALPRRVWAVAGVTPREIDEHEPSKDIREVDGAGEVCAEFHDLVQGCGYGLQWEP